MIRFGNNRKRRPWKSKDFILCWCLWTFDDNDSRIPRVHYSNIWHSILRCRWTKSNEFISEPFRFNRVLFRWHWMKEKWRYRNRRLNCFLYIWWDCDCVDLFVCPRTDAALFHRLIKMQALNHLKWCVQYKSNSFISLFVRLARFFGPLHCLWRMHVKKIEKK